MKCLVVIDVQNDFVSGSLGTPEAQAMLPRLEEKLRGFEGCVWMTLDTHGADYMDTQEGKHLPVPHCVRETEGWQLAGELGKLAESLGAGIVEKPTFGSEELVASLKALYEAGELESIELVGLCTDICVVSNALMLKAAMPELPMSVDSACCAGVTPQKHEAALEVMRSCQIAVK
ncbi:MAG: cysteine hydrolase family protein [Oscillospiraceae bacterium]|jgi:nicotinamidase-related amidase